MNRRALVGRSRRESSRNGSVDSDRFPVPPNAVQAASFHFRLFFSHEANAIARRILPPIILQASVVPHLDGTCNRPVSTAQSERNELWCEPSSGVTEPW